MTDNNPGKLLHATPTKNVESIFRDGLVPQESFMFSDINAQVVNLSTDDESSLVAFFADANGVMAQDGSGKMLDTITLLEVDTRGLVLEWPGQDGDSHFVAREVIKPDRIRVVSTCTLAQVEEWHGDDD